MIVLSIETITRAGSLAIVADEGSGLGAHGARRMEDGWVVASTTGTSTRTHAERLPGEAIDFLGAHGLTLEDVTLFAIVSGPGSFTGIRVGMAAVQGLAFGGRKRAIGIGSLEATVEAWLGGGDPQDRQRLLICPCIDAARGEVYFAIYEVPREAATVEACRILMGPGVAPPAQVAAIVAKVAAGRAVTFVGDGAVRYAGELGGGPEGLGAWGLDSGLEARGAGLGEEHRQASRPQAPKPPSPQVLKPSGVQAIDWPVPLAEGAARIAARRHAEAGAPHALQPIYVRRPDVELAKDIGKSGHRTGGEPKGPKGPIGPTGPPLSISRAESADIEAVERLQRATFSNPWGADAIRWELDNTDVARLYVMRDAAGALAGYCACWVVFDELHINSLAIDPARRRQGLARYLLQHVLAEARAAGATSSTLEVRASNLAARQLYEGLGFAVEAVRRDYYQQPREDAIILWKRGL